MYPIIVTLVMLAQPVTVDTTTPASEAPPKAWQYTLNIGSNFAYSHNAGVVGTPDGSTIKLGLQLDAGSTWAKGSHSITNTFEMREAFGKTPQLAPWIKSLDIFKLANTYAYALPNVTWLAPFVSFVLQTQALPGFDLRTQATTVVRIHTNGTRELRDYGAQRRIALTSAFEPLQLRESTGLSATAVKRKDVTVQANLGIAAQQIITRGGYVIDDDTSTDTLELRQLRTQKQAGGEVGVKAFGEWTERITYRAEANVFQPFYTDDALKGIDALQAEFKFTLSLKVFTWVSLDYVLNSKRVPSITRHWQTQNGLVLTTQYQIF